MAAEPFEVSISEAEIADLRGRLRRTRWPEPEPVDDWSQGLPLAYAQELCRSWAEDYDFGFAARLNTFPQYRDTVDGLGIHFLHVRSPEPDAQRAEDLQELQHRSRPPVRGSTTPSS